jgi:predicted phage-related endonuclease
MKILNLRQGEPAWHTHRATKDNASDAPAMLGESPHCTRSELMHRRATGIVPEVDGATQGRYNDGHAVEALLIPLAAEQLGEPLHPFVAVADFDENLSASFDGCTFVGDVTVECKLLNQRLRAAFADMETIAPAHRERSAGKCLPIDYQIQQEQQVRIAGSERSLFMTGELRSDGTLGDVFSCWYYPDDALWARIQSGWVQFRADLAAYVPPEATDPAPVGRAPESLPALRIELSGAVTASNLSEFKATALGAIRSVNRELSTDQHFADAKQAVKWCNEVESRIKAAKEHALSQTATIDELFRTLDDVSAEARKVRLDLEKLVTRREGEIKTELVTAAKSAYEAHEAACRQDAGAWIAIPQPDFAGAIKGKRSVDSMRDALDVALAKAKIAASEQASKIRANLTALDEESKGFEHLFRDRLTFIGLTPEAVRLMVRQRIAEHRAAEERRAADLAERERERIRREEAERADREARERQQAEQRAATVAAAPAATTAPAQATAPNAASAASGNVRPLQRPTPAPAAQPSLRLGQINERIAPLTVTAEGLRALGFEAAGRERSAVLYHESDFLPIVRAAIAHLEDVADQRAAA